jgi:putative transcriptional regulator
VGRFEELAMTQAYAIWGEKRARTPYHYVQCGLDDVFLLNGYTRHRTPYGAGVSIEDVEGLHNVIAQHICLSKASLSGKEFRFLRKLMDLTQVEVAVNLGYDVQSVARWEKGKAEVNGAADRLLRILFLGSQSVDMEPAELIKIIATLDAKIKDRQVFEETEAGWKAAA